MSTAEFYVLISLGIFIGSGFLVIFVLIFRAFLNFIDF
jgi:hypothetical protein